MRCAYFLPLSGSDSKDLGSGGLDEVREAPRQSVDPLGFDESERGPQTTSPSSSKPISRLDQHDQDLARQVPEAIAFRAEANRWQQQPA